MASDPDLSLIQSIAQGDKSALEMLYNRHAANLLAYLIGQLNHRQLAEDVLQEVMLAIWQGARRFRGESTVQTWIYSIARRRAISARRREPSHTTTLDDQTASSHLGPHETIEWKTEQTDVRAALQQLPADQRETLELIFYHGLTGPQAAVVMGVAPGTVKSRMSRAKVMLQRLLREIVDA